MLAKVKKVSDPAATQNGLFTAHKKKLKFLSKMTKSSPYERMKADDDIIEVKKLKKKQKKVKKAETEEGKENNEVKEKKSKKKTWKLIRQATLTTCRYIGMGVAHMSPATAYGNSDYYIDPKIWNKSFNSSIKNRLPPETQPHWSSTMMFSSW